MPSKACMRWHCIAGDEGAPPARCKSECRLRSDMTELQSSCDVLRTVPANALPGTCTVCHLLRVSVYSKAYMRRACSCPWIISCSLQFIPALMYSIALVCIFDLVDLVNLACQFELYFFCTIFLFLLKACMCPQ